MDVSFPTHLCLYIPSKTNIASEHRLLEKEKPIGKPSFLGAFAVSFREGSIM